MRLNGRSLVLVAVILVVALAGQGCIFYGPWFFVAAFVLQVDFDKNVDTNTAVDYFFGRHLAIECGVINWLITPNPIMRLRAGDEPVKRAKLPKFITLTMTVFPPGAAKETYPFRMKLNKKHGLYSGYFDTPGGTVLRATRDDECPDYEINANTFIGFSIKPERGRFVKGETLEVGLSVRNIVNVDKCEVKFIPAPPRRSVRQVRWIAEPSSTSTVEVTASDNGINVHCVDTDDGAQGTIRMTLMNGGTEIVGIKCVG